MRKSIPITFRIALTIFFGLCSLPPLLFGLYLFGCSCLIHLTNVYYVEYPYIGVGSIFLSIGLFSLYCTWYGAWRRSWYGSLFIIPLVFGLATMVYTPDGRPRVTGMMDGANYESNIYSFFQVWYQANHRFPRSEAEFEEALKNGPAAWQYRVNPVPLQSSYSQAGQRIPYQLVVVNDATGPRLGNLSDRPAVIYYCVSSDGQQYWLTMTGLQKEASSHATIFGEIDKKPMIATDTGRHQQMKAVN